jgi:hypothetical protein
MKMNPIHPANKKAFQDISSHIQTLICRLQLIEGVEDSAKFTLAEAAGKITTASAIVFSQPNEGY